MGEAGGAGRLPRIGPEEFDGERLRLPGVVAVAFLADWCPFCHAFEPRFAGLTPGAPARLLVADMTSEDSPLWERFRIEVVPTVIVFRGGSAVFRVDGVAGEGLGPRELTAIERAVDRAAGRPSPGR